VRVSTSLHRAACVIQDWVSCGRAGTHTSGNSQRAGRYCPVATRAQGPGMAEENIRASEQHAWSVTLYGGRREGAGIGKAAMVRGSCNGFGSFDHSRESRRGIQAVINQLSLSPGHPQAPDTRRVQAGHVRPTHKNSPIPVVPLRYGIRGRNGPLSSSFVVSFQQACKLGKLMSFVPRSAHRIAD
jgi:hypothetical protein